MKINTQCQLCQTRPRTKAIYTWTGEPDIWLLCDECTKPSSRFSPTYKENKDLTHRYPLDDTYLRDVERGFAFLFKFADRKTHPDPDTYLFVPGLPSRYSTVDVYNLSEQKTSNGWWDWPIEVMPWPDFANLPTLISPSFDLIKTIKENVNEQRN